MTTYQPPVGPGLPDVFQQSTPYYLGSYATRQGPIEGMRYATQQLKVPSADGKHMVNGPIYWRAEFFDSRAGLNFQRGRMDKGHARVSESTLEHDHEGHLILPQAWASSATPDPTVTNLRFLSYVNAFNTMIMAMGSGANVSLLREASATDPTPTAVTYSPGDDILSLSKVILNSVDVVMIGRAVSVAQYMTSATAISGTSGHASTTGLYGAVQTPRNGGEVFLSSNGGFYILPSSAALNGDPGTIIRSTPNAAFRPWGLLALGNGPLRIWGLSSNGSYSATSEAVSWPSRLSSVSLDALDFQHRVWPIKDLLGGGIVRNGLVGHNLTQIVYDNGRGAPRDLHIFENRKPTADYVYRIAGIYTDGDNLDVEINLVSTGLNHTQRWRERYDWDLDAWVNKSAHQTLSAGGVYNPLGVSGGLPYSRATNYVQTYVDGSWRRQYAPPSAINPYSLRHVAGDQSGTGVATEASGTQTWPELELPGLEGMPKVLRRITMVGDIDAGGTGGTPAYATVKPFPGAVAGMTATFKATGKGITQRYPFPDSNSPFYRLQPEIALYRQVGGTDPTLYNMNGLPVIFEGLAWPDREQFKGMLLENTA